MQHKLKSIAGILIVVFVGFIAYVEYTQLPKRSSDSEKESNTVNTEVPTVTTSASQPASNTATITIGKDFFLSTFGLTGIPTATVTIRAKDITTSVTIPTNPDGTIKDDPFVAVPIPTDTTYPSDVTVALIAPNASVKLQTTVTLTQKNQPAITDADWTPVAN